MVVPVSYILCNVDYKILEKISSLPKLVKTISYTNLYSVGVLDMLCVDLHKFNSGMVVPAAIPQMSIDDDDPIIRPSP